MGEALEPFEASPVRVAELLHHLDAAIRDEHASLYDARFATVIRSQTVSRIVFETKLELPAELAKPPPTESKREPPFEPEPGPFYVFIDEENARAQALVAKIEAAGRRGA